MVGGTRPRGSREARRSREKPRPPLSTHLQSMEHLRRHHALRWHPIRLGGRRTPACLPQVQSGRRPSRESRRAPPSSWRCPARAASVTRAEVNLSSDKRLARSATCAGGSMAAPASRASASISPNRSRAACKSCGVKSVSCAPSATSTAPCELVTNSLYCWLALIIMGLRRSTYSVSDSSPPPHPEASNATHNTNGTNRLTAIGYQLSRPAGIIWDP